MSVIDTITMEEIEENFSELLKGSALPELSKFLLCADSTVLNFKQASILYLRVLLLNR